MTYHWILFRRRVENLFDDDVSMNRISSTDAKRLGRPRKMKVSNESRERDSNPFNATEFGAFRFTRSIHSVRNSHRAGGTADIIRESFPNAKTSPLKVRPLFTTPRRICATLAFPAF